MAGGGDQLERGRAGEGLGGEHDVEAERPTTEAPLEPAEEGRAEGDAEVVGWQGGSHLLGREAVDDDDRVGRCDRPCCRRPLRSTLKGVGRSWAELASVSDRGHRTELRAAHA